MKWELTQTKTKHYATKTITRKTHKKVYPITVTGLPVDEEAEIQSEAAKVSEVGYLVMKDAETHKM